YRGNWAPQIARNIILRYSQPGDIVLDQMVGGGTTLVECKLTSRHAIGVDVNRDALMLTLDRLNFSLVPEGRQTRLLEHATPYGAPAIEHPPAPRGAPKDLTLVEPSIRLYQGDARRLDLIPDASIDLVATHPPYANIIRYSRQAPERIPHDLSNVRDIADYVAEMRRVADESYRVLKPGRFCAILMGDTRRNRHYTPIAFRVMQAFLEAGFILKEDIIKAQWNTQTEGLWARMSREKNFLLIMHEHLFIFRKPAPDEDLRPYAESAAWW
ncbi:MAG: DNA methylase, partial [Chloroflexi bacterium]|nr:DNA methylase [Chloroflexota bacterium]